MDSCDTPPNSLKDSTEGLKAKTSEGEIIGAHSLARSNLGLEGCVGAPRWTRMSDKRFNYSHGLAQTKQQVGQCKVETLLVHKRTTSKHELTRLNTAQTWEKPSPSPLQYTLCMATGPMPKCHFVPELPSGSLKIFKFGIHVTLEAHNFVCRPLI